MGNNKKHRQSNSANQNNTNINSANYQSLSIGANDTMYTDISSIMSISSSSHNNTNSGNSDCHNDNDNDNSHNNNNNSNNRLDEYDEEKGASISVLSLCANNDIA